MTRRGLRATLGRFATGVSVVTARGPNGPVGLTVNSFTSVSLDPPLILVCIDLESPTLGVLMRRRAFAINVLRAGAADVARLFSGRRRDRFAGQSLRSGENGAPILTDSLAWFECSVWQSLRAGDHRVVIGHVDRFASEDGAPLVFFGGAYRGLEP